MFDHSKTLKLAAAALILFSLTSPASATQDKKEKEPTPKGNPVLWRAPGDIAARDLFLGQGGKEMRPDLRRVTFLKEEKPPSGASGSTCRGCGASAATATTPRTTPGTPSSKT